VTFESENVFAQSNVSR